ncbi:MAG TPA: hypothetical protein VN520_13395 [Streptomyces sp.]|uniref:hypothetical protein n=1 Tax=Streptomyces sp. TaxID=1931 RepID=UPI002BF00A45|nr:hypothetical protein [Streptomyces sp.]HWU07351.1 hypothetical protein [Streptomyces sp.]
MTVNGLRFRGVRLTPYTSDGQAVERDVRTWPWLGVACRDEAGTRLWLETTESVAGAVQQFPPPPVDGWHEVALWADTPDGDLGQAVVREVEGLRLWAVGLGYVALYGGPGKEPELTRVPTPPAGVELGSGDRPGAWSAAALGRQIADECRSTEEARQRRRTAVEAARHERRTARQRARA